MTTSLAFISYRREDEGPTARFVKAELERIFGANKIFMDVDNIRIGSDWTAAINENLKKATILIAIIGRNWLKVTDEYHRRRIDNDKDWVRTEIEFALENNITIIPFLIGCKIPPKEGLPETLERLVHFEALSLSASNWRHDLGKLIEIMISSGFNTSSPELAMPDLVSDMLFPLPIPISHINNELKGFVGWKVVEYYSKEKIPQPGIAIEKMFEFKSFEMVIKFIETVSDHISNIQHHPEWENIWKYLRVRLSTWDIGHKVTSLDISLARYLEGKYLEINLKH